MFPSDTQKRLPRHAMLSDEAAERYARTTQLGAYSLIPSEFFWQARQPHLQRHGYLLRSRYTPGWEPSWLGSNLAPMFCEDSIMSMKDEVMDAKRSRDNALVAIKIVEKDSGEVHIAQYLTSLRDSQNHCVPILDVLLDPFDSDFAFIVMPYLRPYNDPPFYMISEVIDFIDQTLEGLTFLHRNRVAHRDISAPNIMMDGRPLFPDGHHPVRRNYTPDGIYTITGRSRTEHSVRYYYIDFGLSTRFPEDASLYVVGDIGRDRDVPELSDDVPYDAFKVDIFSLGNLYDKEFEQNYNNMDFLTSLIARMKQRDPNMRPSMEEIIADWQETKAGLDSSVYRRRLGAKSEQPIERVINDTVAAAWQGFNQLKRLVK